MKKKNIALFFLRNLLKSLLLILSVILVGVISYLISYKILEGKQENPNDISKQIEDILQEAQTDEVSKNLIYVVDKKDNISHIMLEICNTTTHNIDYITIPVRTDYTIPMKMYQKLCTVDQEIPQIVRLSKLRTYFDSDNGYGYGELIIEKMLGAQISYYTVIEEDVYANHYVEKEVTTAYESGNSQSSVTMNISVASDSYLSQLADLGGEEEKIAEYIKDQYARVSSNLTVYNKIGYIEAYEQMNASYFHYWGVPGSFSGKTFTVDQEAASDIISGLENNTVSYSEAQNFDVKEAKKGKNASSKGLNILILNGSKISGLAGSTQEKLVTDGYTVPKVGDYKSETLTQTKIIVTKNGMGKDLAAYFKDPEITVGTVEDGYDIQIVLGTVDAN